MVDIVTEDDNKDLPKVNLPVVDWGSNKTIEMPKGYTSKFNDTFFSREDEEVEKFQEEDYLKGNEKGELTKKDVVNNENFISSARRFLKEREPGVYDTNEEVFDAFMNHFRHQDVNELTAINDLEYAQKADNQAKQDLFNLMTTYDKMTGEEGTLSFFADYAGGLIRAPSTYLSLISGGGGKAAAIAANQGIKWSIKKVLLQGLKRSSLGAGVEGIAGAVQGATAEAARKEVGMEGDILLGAGVGFGAGMIPGLGIGTATSVRAIKKGQELGFLQKEGRETFEASLAKSNDVAEEVVGKNKKFADTFQEKLIDLDERRAAIDTQKRSLSEAVTPDGDPAVETGLRIKVEGKRETTGINKGRLLEGEVDYMLQLSSNSIKRVTAAAYDVLKAAKIENPNLLDSDKRITELVYDALLKDEKLLFQIDDIAKKYNLNQKEFSTLFIADASEAGRTLQLVGALQRRLKSGDITREAYEAKLKDIPKELLTDGERFKQTISKVLPEGAIEKIKFEKFGRAGQALWSWTRNVDILRRGFMVIQPKTTLRNMANAGIRVPMYMLDNMLAGRGGPEGIIDTLKLPFDFLTRGEADAFAHVFSEANPKQYQQLFRSAMDLNVELGSLTEGSGIGRMARKMNVLNTMLDNGIKRTIFFNEVKLAAGGSSKLKSMMKDGSLNDWLARNPDSMARAMDEALSFTYQKGYAKGPARWIVNQSSNPLFTAFIPFPRFLVNQTQFVYEHMPLLSFAVDIGRSVIPKGTDTVVKKQAKFKDRLAKQVTGTAILYAAMQIRSIQGPDLPWNQVRDPDGKPKDVTALLGPFAPFMFLADFIYRTTSGGKDSDFRDQYLFPVVDADKYEKFDYNQINWREVSKAFTGMQVKGGFNTGLSVIDELGTQLQEIGNLDENSPGFSKKAERLGARLAANYVRTFTVPVGIAKDVIGTFDPEGRKLYDTDSIDLGAYFWRKAVGSAPPSGTLPEESLFREFLEEKRDEPRLLQIPEKEKSPETTVPLYATFTGATGVEEMGDWQREMVRLQVPITDFYKRSKDPDRNYFRKFFLGREVKNLEAIINRPSYKRKNPDQKRAELFSGTKSHVSQVRKQAYKLADEYLATMNLPSVEKPSGIMRDTRISSALDRVKYNELPAKDKKVIENFFIETGRGDIYENNYYRQALEFHKEFKDAGFINIYGTEFE